MREWLQLSVGVWVVTAGAAGACKTSQPAPTPVTVHTDLGRSVTDATSDAGATSARTNNPLEAVVRRLQTPPNDHRERAQTCTPTPPGNGRPGVNGDCEKDADCKAGRNGRCHYSPGGHIPERNSCTYDTCLSDADCPGDKGVCDCSGHQCYSASNCRVDGDCGSGFCSLSRTGPRCFSNDAGAGYFCHTPQDECVNNEDCRDTGGTYSSSECLFSPSAGKWKCITLSCVVG